MVINAMGFGIIIPVMYPFSKALGITEQTLGWLMAAFSLAQFFATPILGKLSDRVGRKPVLIVCLVGTAISFLLFAEAGSVFMLFFARILDGVTGGNISVAQAVIADTTSKEERTKAFGLLAASLGIGFLLGPVIGGLLSAISLKTPFLFAAGLSLFGVLVSIFFLKETNKFQKEATEERRPLIDFKELIATLGKPFVGFVILIGFFTATANFAMFTGFQTFNSDVLKLTATEIGLFFGAFAILSILMQAVLLKHILKLFSSKVQILAIALTATSIAMLFAGMAVTVFAFCASILTYAIFNSVRDPLLQSLISEHSHKDEQGKMLGINQSYLSIGQIVGPVMAGYASKFSISYVFPSAAGFIVLGLCCCVWLLKKK